MGAYKESDSASGGGEGDGDVRGRGKRVAMSSWGGVGLLVGMGGRGGCWEGGMDVVMWRTECVVEGSGGGRYCERAVKFGLGWDSLLTSETPLARRALISSSLSSGQAIGEAEVRVRR